MESNASCQCLRRRLHEYENGKTYFFLRPPYLPPFFSFSGGVGVREPPGAGLDVCLAGPGELGICAGLFDVAEYTFDLPERWSSMSCRLAS